MSDPHGYSAEANCSPVSSSTAETSADQPISHQSGQECSGAEPLTGPSCTHDQPSHVEGDGGKLDGVQQTKDGLAELSEWALETLYDPWEARPEKVLRAVEAARMLPTVQNQDEHNLKLAEYGVSFPLETRSTCAAPSSLGPPSSSAGTKIGNESGVTSRDTRPGSASMRRGWAAVQSKPIARLGGHAAQSRAASVHARRQPRLRLPREALRQAFIDQALSYVGTPYLRMKSHPAEHAAGYKALPAALDGTAPVPGAHGRPGLALDCSALVRQVLFDLRAHFGFVVGGWNQAYQFDTLPLAADGAEQLQPGDLIFISGRYFDASRSRKPHDMTHVEIYFPRGPARTQTIGSRHKSGCVQVHRDFRFESKTYHSMRYHFRRIDTWLDGTCQSHCKEHRWVNG